MLTSILADPIRAAMFAVGHLLGGSLGAGIVAVSFLMRLALMPLTLRLARRSAAQQRLLRGIKPELAALNERLKKDPEKLWDETLALYQRVGYKPFDPPVVFGNLARLPIFAGIYGALRTMRGGAFGSILDLARPSAPLALLVAAISGATAWIGTQTGATNGRMSAALAVLATGVSLALFWHVSSALVLSWGASSILDVTQGALLLRQSRRSGDR